MKKRLLLFAILFFGLCGCDKDNGEDVDPPGIGHFVWVNASDHRITMTVNGQFEDEIMLPGERISKTMIGFIALPPSPDLYVMHGIEIVFDDGPYGGVFTRPKEYPAAPYNPCNEKEYVWEDMPVENDLSLVQEEQAVYDFTGKKVLLAEDTAFNEEVATELLAMVHMDVDCAHNGKEAVELFEKAKPGTYMAILMDIHMPVMNGYEAARTIRKSEREDAGTIAIYAMTANSFEEDVSAALNAGMNGHIAKPIDAQILYEVLDKLAKKQQ